MPVDGELFCLQCGRVVKLPKGEKTAPPSLENTADPLLRKAITDTLGHPVKWKLPVSGAAPVKTAFASLPKALAPVRPLSAAAGAGVAVDTAVAVKVPEVKHGVAALNLLTKQVKARKQGMGWRLPGLGWTVGLVAALAFVGVNVGLYGYYGARVYPGVKVGNLDAGGLTQSQLEAELGALKLPAKIDVTIGGARYSVKAAGLARTDVARAAREAMNRGHDVTLPLAGFIEAAWSKPLALPRTVDDAALGRVVADLAARSDHVASNPVPVIVGGLAIELGGKGGDELDQAAAVSAIKAALAAGQGSVSLPLKQTQPLLADNAFQGDMAAAQARLGLSLKLTDKAASYVPTPATVGGWLVFNGAGKGVSANPAAVAAYVTSLPGKFDRAAAYSALLAAVNSGQNLNYTIASKVTAVPPAATQASPLLPVVYKYCLIAPSGDEAQLSQQVTSTLGDTLGWALGGRVRFVAATGGCNFSLALVGWSDMSQLDARCGGQSSCRVGNQLEVNLSDWSQVPSKWTAGLASYRGELVGNEVGHWLGFEHSACLSSSSPTSVLQTPALVLDGCSPNWYPIAQADSNKVLSGFR